MVLDFMGSAIDDATGAHKGMSPVQNRRLLAAVLGSALAGYGVTFGFQLVRESANFGLVLELGEVRQFEARHRLVIRVRNDTHRDVVIRRWLVVTSSAWTYVDSTCIVPARSGVLSVLDFPSVRLAADSRARAAEPLRLVPLLENGPIQLDGWNLR